MNRKGFTLIELVMVIVIIGILAAIAVPRFASLRRDARKASCDGNVGAIRTALSAYYSKTAITPGWTTGEGSSGFPAALDNANFRDCFFATALLPTCPATGTNTVYVNHYTSGTGSITLHTAGSH